MDGLLRRYTFKLYPNVAQGAALEQQRRLHSALYNALIEQRIDAYRRGDAYERALGKKQGKRGGVTLTAFDQGKEVTRLRAADPEYNALSRGSMEQTCKRVDLAFEAFFKRAKGGAGASSGFPRFKRCDGFGFREQSHGGWDFVDNHLRLQGVVGTIRARGRFPGEPREVRTCDLRLTGGGWWLSIVVRMDARMDAREHRNGRVEFDLLDEFARVSCADGEYGSGPEETVYAAADGRITPIRSMGSAGAPAAPSGLGGERRRTARLSTERAPAAPSGLGGERRKQEGLGDGAILRPPPVWGVSVGR